MSIEQNNSQQLSLWLHASRWGSLLLPIGFLVLVLFLLLITLVYLTNRSSQEVFERQAEVQVLDMAETLAQQLDQELTMLRKQGELLASQAARHLASDPPTTLASLPSLKRSPEGMLYSPDPQGPAYYFSALQQRSLDQDAEQIWRLAQLAPLLEDIQTQQPLVSQAYINTRNTELLLYPWFDVPAHFLPDLDVREFPFYYQADQLNNPQLQPVWLDTYQDPAGQGWVITLSVPVVIDGEVVAVAGLDITLEALINRLMDFTVPWKGFTQLMSADASLLAQPPATDEVWQVHRGALQLSSQEPLDLKIEPSLDPRLEPLRQDASGLLQLHAEEEAVLVSWSSLSATGWKLLLVAPKAEVFKARQQLLDDYQLLIWLGGSSLLLTSAFLVFLVRRRDQRLLDFLQQLAWAQKPPVDVVKPAETSPSSDVLQHLPGPLLICQFDRDEKISSCNLAFERYMKSSRAHLQGQPLAPLLAMQKLPPGSWMDELELTVPEQEKTRTWWLSLARQEDQGGYAFLLDLTRYNLTQQQLRNERERARQAAKMKTEFSLVVIREANSLLSQLYQASLQMNNPEKSSACREKIQAVQRLMDDLLDMSDESEALEARDADLEELNLVDWVTEAQQAIDPQLQQQGRQLIVDYAEGLPELVLGDRRRLKRLLRHLLRQSLQMSSRGELQLKLQGSSDQKKLLIELVDSGGKLAEEERKRRYQATTPLGSNYEPAEGGLSLGPLLVRQLVQELKGSLDVQVRPEGGLQLSLTLPLLLQVEAQPKANILVVDDGPVNSMLASSVLEKSGYKVEVASSGYKALELALSNQYDLVLMDIFMPGMDGLETASHWRKLDNPNAKIPIIAVTANAQEGDLARFYDQGINAYLAKPYRPAELRELVKRWLPNH